MAPNRRKKSRAHSKVASKNARKARTKRSSAQSEQERKSRRVREVEGSRSAFARDRDRILHCSALRRLAQVTQVVDSSEGHVFHNRLTHSLKVAQIARRLAERLLAEQPDEAKQVGLNPEVAEAAALAHDLGHPPFGHVGEATLNELFKEEENPQGFEGNAQSFRIVSSLCVRDSSYAGLNLTRATLNAILKYPWVRDLKDQKRSKKWGAYEDTEGAALTFARLGFADGIRSVEAEIMDWSDDITYAVHDMEDFYRAGLIPLDRLTIYGQERDLWINAVFERRTEAQIGLSRQRFAEVANRIFDAFSTRERYSGSKRQRAALKKTGSALINQYVHSFSLNGVSDASSTMVTIEPEAEADLKVLKQLTWHYVILNPALSSQQYGKAKIIRNLFDTYMNISIDKKWSAVMPVRFIESLQNVSKKRDRMRAVADLICGFSDSEAVIMHQKLTGAHTGSILDFLPS